MTPYRLSLWLALNHVFVYLFIYCARARSASLFGAKRTTCGVATLRLLGSGTSQPPSRRTRETEQETALVGCTPPHIFFVAAALFFCCFFSFFAIFLKQRGRGFGDRPISAVAQSGLERRRDHLLELLVDFKQNDVAARHVFIVQIFKKKTFAVARNRCKVGSLLSWIFESVNRCTNWLKNREALAKISNL